MASSEIKKLSTEDIEQKAEEVLNKWFSSVLTKPQLTPLNKFCLKLKEEHETTIEFTKDLGYVKGKKVWGIFHPDPRSIFIDRFLLHDTRRPFVLAHEIGHLVLHRKLALEEKIYEINADTEMDFLTGKKILMSDRDWIEWQANKFASCFLMPRRTFLDALIQVQKEMGITRNLGVVYVGQQDYSKIDFEKLKKRLALIYNVNKTNIEIRLKDLNLLDDARYDEIQSISQFFKVA